MFVDTVCARKSPTARYTRTKAVDKLKSKRISQAHFSQDVEEMEVT